MFVLSIALASSCGGDNGENSTTPYVEATVAATVRPTSPAARASALCAFATLSAETSNVLESDISELSGLAASTKNAGVLWAHNDSGDTARVFAFSAKGEPRALYDVTGADAMDWEDMAIGPGPQAGQDYLYLGDIGDNAAKRTEIAVYRAVEPDIDAKVGPDIEGVERIVLRYPDAPHDAETLLIDPLSGDLVIVTKEIATGNAGVYWASADALATGDATLERVGEIEKAQLTSATVAPETTSPLVRGVGYLPTGGDVSRDGALIAIRTYGAVFVWARNGGAPLADALAGDPCEAPSAIEPQGEAIAINTGGDGYFTASEGANPPLHQFGQE
jgi:hypothetical protein